MAPIIKNNFKIKAKTVDNNSSGCCSFCERNENNEALYGKMYIIGDLYCHYFCVLLSCCLIQKGSDDDGLLGFLYPDILVEINRSKKHKCSYCKKGGASMGCSKRQCKKQFHLPCGLEHESISLFFDKFETFCNQHAPQQTIANDINLKVQERKSRARKLERLKNTNSDEKLLLSIDDSKSLVCVICYEEIDGIPSTRSFWPPCCARDEWFHRSCLQNMCLSAGMYFLRCPLCNDKEQFYNAVINQGYYVPDRDASWELEQNAFSDIYERRLVCDANICKCPEGRNYDSEKGLWDITLCIMCGCAGAHEGCRTNCWPRFVCDECVKSLPDDPQSLLETINTLMKQEEIERKRKMEEKNQQTLCKPIMPTRMSLRSTKPGVKKYHGETVVATTCSNLNTQTDNSSIRIKADVTLKTPQKNVPVRQPPEMLTPMKILENELEKMPVKINRELLESIKSKLVKPRPLSIKKKIIGHCIGELYDDMVPKIQKTPKKSLTTPSKQIEKEESVQKTPITPAVITTPHLSESNIQMNLEENLNNITPLVVPVKRKIFDSPENEYIKEEATNKDSQLDLDIEVKNVAKRRKKNKPSNEKIKNSKKSRSKHRKKIKAKNKIKIDKKIRIKYRNNESKKNMLKKKIKMKSAVNKIRYYETNDRDDESYNNLYIKLKWRKNNIELKMKQKNKMKDNKYKQTQLIFTPLGSQDKVIAKPEIKVSPKIKKIKKEPSSDGLKQPTIQSFFTSKSG